MHYKENEAKLCTVRKQNKVNTIIVLYTVTEVSLLNLLRLVHLTNQKYLASNSVGGLLGFIALTLGHRY